MTDEKSIEQAIKDGKLDEAIKMLDTNISADADNAQWWYMRGRVYWRMDMRGRAISDYEESVHRDANSPAVHALEMVRNIMDFYNTDLYNP